MESGGDNQVNEQAGGAGGRPVKAGRSCGGGDVGDVSWRKAYHLINLNINISINSGGGRRRRISTASKAASAKRRRVRRAAYQRRWRQQRRAYQRMAASGVRGESGAGISGESSVSALAAARVCVAA